MSKGSLTGFKYRNFSNTIKRVSSGKKKKHAILVTKNNEVTNA